MLIFRSREASIKAGDGLLVRFFLPALSDLHPDLKLYHTVTVVLTFAALALFTCLFSSKLKKSERSIRKSGPHARDFSLFIKDLPEFALATNSTVLKRMLLDPKSNFIDQNLTLAEIYLTSHVEGLCKDQVQIVDICFVPLDASIL